MSEEVACKQKEGTFQLQPKQSRGIPLKLPGKTRQLSPLNITLLSKKTMKTVTCCCAKRKEVLQEHPDLSSTSFYSQPVCVLPAPLVQTPHPSRRASHGGGRTKDVTVWCCVCSCACVCFVLWWRAAAVECSTYEMMQPSMKSPLFSFKGLTWIFNDEPVSLICQIYSMTPFFLMHI